LLVASAALANGGTLYQPTLLHSFLDPDGNVIMPFQSKIARTLLPPKPGEVAVFNLREDMLLQGKRSLACICEPRSPYKDPNNPDLYDPTLPECTDEFKQNYRRTVTLEGRGEVTYTVHIPYGYRFGGVCNPLFINDALYRNYQPPFVSASHIAVIQEGMRQAVLSPLGTARRFNLSYVQTAGKTGTAEYCDDIAAARQLCKPGQWPAHAWFFGYAPFEKPEIGVIVFVYNAGEGSANALPVAKAVVDCYFTLKSQREQGVPNDQVSCTPVQD
jgi:membrane carboxypeptidase/penicillin-binding protein